MALTEAAPALAEIDGYTRLREERSAGIGYTVLEHASGVQLCLSQDGHDAMQHMKGFADLIGRMTTFIGENDSYVFDTGIERERENMEAIRIAGRRTTNGSIYSPYALQSLIVKTFHDAGNHSAPLQLRTMSWLHHKLLQSDQSNLDVRLSAPAQYAMLTSPSNQQKTVIMERAAGTSLQYTTAGLIKNGLTIAEKQHLARTMPPRIAYALRQTIGFGVHLLTDVEHNKNRDNFIIDDPLSDLPNVAIIDQPRNGMLGSRARAKLLLASLR